MEMITVTVPVDAQVLYVVAEWLEKRAAQEAGATSAPVHTIEDIDILQRTKWISPASVPLPVAPEPAPVPPPVAPVALDADGLPWDSRIHSSSKNLTADGKWRYRRGLDPTIKHEVLGQLRAAMAAPVAAPVPPPAAPAPVPPPAVPAPVPPPAVPAPVPPPAAPAPGTIASFQDLLQAVIKRGITADICNATAVELKLPSFALIATRPDLIPTFAAKLGL